MKLLLARHGNTFEAGEPAYVVGRRQDLPLTREGIAQAERIGAYCQAEPPAAVYCGTLHRTRHTAGIVVRLCGSPAPCDDSRLTELDFGEWGGLTMDEVRRKFGDAEADAWEHDARMPAGRGWSPDAAVLTEAVQGFIADMRQAHADGTVLAVTSNGVLRYFAHIVPGLFKRLRDEGGLKVKTGHLCAFDIADEPKLLFWNQPPG
jgi:probable phosphoglycerate mutase